MQKEGEPDVNQTTGRRSKMRGDIILLPQPTDDSADPLVSFHFLFRTRCSRCSIIGS